MKKKFFILALIFVTGLLINSCKKYPEDKFISFTTVKMRLEGEWQLERIEINDENVGYKYSDSLTPLSFKDFKFWFIFDYTLETPVGYKKETTDLLLINKTSKNRDDAVNDAEVSGLGFTIYPKKEKELGIGGSKKLFSINDSNAYRVLKNLLFNYWEIKSLHNKNLILEKTKNGIKRRLYLKKNRNK